ncbi:IS66 family insertion sequence element accessory protein TnpB [Salmonella enterica]|nr:IS66 family insertion sequence element accessory protein TnpB [Salmonella enterica]ELM3580508.1 IS66 family insertion sequence element accessory protein TnpB [Salmonella enterica]
MLTPERLFIAIAPVDMRRGIDTLSQLVADNLHTDWRDGAAFVFCNRARSRIKILRWDKHGVWLSTRRLHRGHFVWPRATDDVRPLTREQFSWLIKGVDWQQIDGADLTQWR